MMRSVPSGAGSPTFARGATHRSSPSGWWPCEPRPPRIATSSLPCWTVPERTARSTKSGMCWKRYMGATVSRSSSDLGGTAAVRRRFAPPRPDLRAAPAVRLQLERLTRTRPAGHPVVSCYLKLEPRDRSRGKYLIKLKNRVRLVKTALTQLVRDRAAQEAAERDIDRVIEHLRTPANLPA